MNEHVPPVLDQRQARLEQEPRLPRLTQALHRPEHRHRQLILLLPLLLLLLLRLLRGWKASHCCVLVLVVGLALAGACGDVACGEQGHGANCRGQPS